MKNIFLVLLLFIASSCYNERNKVKSIITDKIKTELPTGWEYTPVMFTAYSDILSDISNEIQYKELSDNYEKALYDYLYDSISIMEQYAADSVIYGENYAKSQKREINSYDKKKIEKEMEELREKYTPYIIGKGIVHVYVCKTNFGDSLYISKFLFNSDLNIIETEKVAFFVEKDSIDSFCQQFKKEEGCSIEKLIGGF